MIAYFDTSAVVPLVIAESGTPLAQRLWDSADRVVSVRLLYPECRAALAQAQRLGRMSASDLRKAVRELDARYDEFDLVELDDGLSRRAGELAEMQRLRGYDSVHLAAAERVGDPEVVLVAGDATLLSAARDLGLSTASVL